MPSAACQARSLTGRTLFFFLAHKERKHIKDQITNVFLSLWFVISLPRLQRRVLLLFHYVLSLSPSSSFLLFTLVSFMCGWQNWTLTCSSKVKKFNMKIARKRYCFTRERESGYSKWNACRLRSPLILYSQSVLQEDFHISTDTETRSLLLSNWKLVQFLVASQRQWKSAFQSSFE